MDFNSQREIIFGHLTINPIYIYMARNMLLVMYNVSFLEITKKYVYIFVALSCYRREYVAELGAEGVFHPRK